MATEPKEDEEKTEPQQQEPAPQEEKKVSINLDEVDEPPEGEEDQQASAETRKSRRAERRELKTTLQETRDKLSQMERAFQEMQARYQQQPQYAPPPPQRESDEKPKGRYEEEINDIEASKQAILSALSNPRLSEDETKAYNRQWEKLNRKGNDLYVKAAIESHLGDRPQLSQEDVGKLQLQSEFPDIYNDPVLLAHAQAEFTYLTQRMGRPNHAGTAREACLRLRSRLAPPQKPPAPTAAQQARYGSVPRSAGSQATSQHYTPTKDVLNTARAYTAHMPDLDDEERVRKWVKDVGKPAGLVAR